MLDTALSVRTSLAYGRKMTSRKYASEILQKVYCYQLHFALKKLDLISPQPLISGIPRLKHFRGALVFSPMKIFTLQRTIDRISIPWAAFSIIYWTASLYS